MQVCKQSRKKRSLGSSERETQMLKALTNRQRDFLRKSALLKDQILNKKYI